MTIAPRPASFRARFLLVLFFASVVPLGLIGVWLTQSVVVAGEELLRSELDRSLDTISARINERWGFRRGELELLARNDAAIRLLSDVNQPVSPEYAAYLTALFATLSRAVLAFEYRNMSGDVRWSSPAPAVDAGTPAPSAELMDTFGQRLTSGSAGPAVTMRLPIVGRMREGRLGEVVAQVSIAALTPIDASLRLPNGARLQWIDRASGRSLLSAFAPDSSLAFERFTAGRTDWLAVHRSLVDPDVDLVLAAPRAAYVQPFERVARTGGVTLLVVALLAFGGSAYLTTRLTGSLERLAAAADAVAGGDLSHRVDGNGAAEVGRVAAAFNSMMASLQRTLAELSKRQALAAAGEFALSLSHEVRNGLTAIRVDLQRAEEKPSGDSTGSALIARALENVKRLDATVTGALRTARSTSAPRRRLELRKVVAAAAQRADSSFTERGAVLSPVPDLSAPAWVLGDDVALEQLLLNLLLNSAQAMKPGGHASLLVDLDGSDVRLVLTDSGSGITPADLEHVFDPFFSTKPEGTGLGLPIARQIATAHGGSLTIDSSADAGTRVEVRLPLAAPPSPTSPLTPAT